MMKRIVFALLLGSAGSLYLLQDDYHTKQWVRRHLIDLLEYAFDCSVTFTLKNVTLLTPSVELEDVIVRPSDASCHWHMTCNTLRIRCSWFSLLCYATLDLSLYCKKVRAYSDASNGSLAITPLVQRALSDSTLPIPIYMRSCTVHDGSITLHEPRTDSTAMLMWESVSRRRNGVLHTDLRAHSGTITSRDRLYCQNAQFHMRTRALNQEIDLSLSGHCELTQVTGRGKLCEYSATWNGTKGTFLCNNADETIVVAPASLSVINGKYMAACTVHAPLSYCAALCTKYHAQYHLTGDCCIRVLVDFSDLFRGINGTLTVQNMRYKTALLASCARLSFVSAGDCWRGSHQIQTDSFGELGGTWVWNWPDGTLLGNAHNKSIIEWPWSTHWTSWPGDCSLSVFCMPSGVLQGTYRCTVSSKKTEESIGSDGTIRIEDGDTTTADGTIGAISYKVSASLSKEVPIQSISCCGEEREELVRFTCDDENQWSANLRLSLLRTLLKRVTACDIQGEGTFVLTGVWDWERPSIQVKLDKGTIRLPGTYNFINDVHANVVLTVDDKRIAIHNVVCGLHYGTISCLQAMVTCDEYWVPRYIHCPLTLNSCLFTLNRDCFFTVSGGMLMQGDPVTIPTVKAHCIIDRAQLGGIIPFFNAQSRLSVPLFFTDMFLKDINCDITVISKHPVAVATDSFKAQAQVHMKMSGSPSDPIVSGDIILASGEIGFPYRPLYISRGHIHFIPGQLNDPVIELIAKNRVKQYNVTMRVLGSAQHHDITFESSPPLTNQQIISLLLAGSSDESLNGIMPALVMQNMKSIMFKSDAFNKSIWRLFRPFRYITLVPSFSDQTGRGGLRGSLEIDIGDRWHALLQKNFSLSEDTLFELEYHISDDIAVRVYRDQRRDVGGEVEVRWKW